MALLTGGLMTARPAGQRRRRWRWVVRRIAPTWAMTRIASSAWSSVPCWSHPVWSCRTTWSG